MSLGLPSSFSQFNIPMAVGSKNGVFQFDNFKLDAANLMLYRDDAEVSLPPKVVKTLAVLVQNGGEIISKDDLIEQVWTDTIVEEANLTQHLYLLRRTLGNRPDGQQYIETLRRRGYRFTGDARRVTPEATSSGRAAIAAPSPARRHDVERRGNVWAVADWQEQVPGGCDGLSCFRLVSVRIDTARRRSAWRSDI